MRPRVSALRTKYRNAFLSLKNLGKPVTLASIATKAGVRFHTARNFFYRNPRFAIEIGLSTRESKTPGEYIEAAKKLHRRKKHINGRTLGVQLGRDHSAVYRFLRAHPDVAAQIYEATGVMVGWTPLPKNVHPSP